MPYSIIFNPQQNMLTPSAQCGTSKFVFPPAAVVPHINRKLLLLLSHHIHYNSKAVLQGEQELVKTTCCAILRLCFNRSSRQIKVSILTVNWTVVVVVESFSLDVLWMNFMDGDVTLYAYKTCDIFMFNFMRNIPSDKL